MPRRPKKTDETTIMPAMLEAPPLPDLMETAKQTVKIIESGTDRVMEMRTQILFGQIVCAYLANENITPSNGHLPVGMMKQAWDVVRSIEEFERSQCQPATAS